MLILIAESKTMGECDAPVTSAEYGSHTPIYEATAEAIMTGVASMTFEELSEKTRLSTAMVRRLQQMAARFPDHSRGTEAIEAYTGVVFKALDYGRLDKSARDMACNDVRIISSLYGWLRPDDIVRPYRLDFGMKLAPDGGRLSAYMKERVNRALAEYLDKNACTDIINLLPGDAAACIDQKAVGKRARIWKIDFRETGPEGHTRTPNAGMLKKLRGELLRQILTETIKTPEEIMALGGESEEEGAIVFRVS
ncbi:MAG: YaaA family protein [Paramuribaculum sp.]|nr:YaaA family protein [Paramuribaculum sp.]